MHVDASAIVAILVNEPERDNLVERLAAGRNRTTSLMSAFEAVIAVGRKTGDRAKGLDLVRRFLARSEISIETGEDRLLEDLADAHIRYGKGSGHPARLNLGDCFSYAMAKHAGVPLIYKGNDFSLTDFA